MQLLPRPLKKSPNRGNPARLRTSQIVRDRAARHAQGAANLARARPAVVHPQHVS
jgi:hypothetical protein